MRNAAIISNRVITPNGVEKAVVLIKNGIIEDIIKTVPGSEYQVTDIGDNVLMAGVIDPHVHINEPGRTEWEGFDTATRAAIAGGITTLVDMPLNSSPVTTTVKAFEEKLRAVDQTVTVRPTVNCAFWGGIIPGNEKEIEPLIKKGVRGFKAFLTHSGIDEFPNATEVDLRKAMPIIAKYNLPLLVHCELSDQTCFAPLAMTQDAGLLTPDLLRSARNDAGLPTPDSYSNYLASRPKTWEDNAIALMIRLCEEFNCRTHIVHLSSADSIEQIVIAKRKGLPLTVETGQHYLYFTAEEIGDGQTQFKCAPPIREKANNEKLWQALKQGIIDFVATDHSPAPPAMKQMSSGDFMKAWGGISSIQFALPVLWTAAKEHDCSLEDVARWLCSQPAILPGLHTTKGKIQKGYDADFVVWDPEKTFTVKENMIYHRHKLTPYLNEKLYGVVEQTWLKGEKVFDKDKFIHLNRGEIIL
jgi:allantoinase